MDARAAAEQQKMLEARGHANHPVAAEAVDFHVVEAEKVEGAPANVPTVEVTATAAAVPVILQAEPVPAHQQLPIIARCRDCQTEYHRDPNAKEASWEYYRCQRCLKGGPLRNCRIF